MNNLYIVLKLVIYMNIVCIDSLCLQNTARCLLHYFYTKDFNSSMFYMLQFYLHTFIRIDFANKTLKTIPYL